MNDFIKKYWFIVLVAIVFVIMIPITIFNTKGTHFVNSKKVDDKYAVFSIGKTNYLADDLYKLAGENYETQLAMLQLERMVISQQYPASQDEKDNAKLSAQQLLTNYRAKNGQEAADISIINQLTQYGYKTDANNLLENLTDYTLTSQLIAKHLHEYIDNNTELLTKWQKDMKPRIVSHIIINLANEENKDEKVVQKKKAQIDKLLKEKDFKEVAKEMGEDGTKSDGGLLGEITTTKSSLVEPFLSEALKLKDGEVSDWIKTEFGYHKIKVITTKLSDLKKEKSFYETILNSYPEVQNQAMWKLIEKANVDFSANPSLGEKIKNIYTNKNNAGGNAK